MQLLEVGWRASRLRLCRVWPARFARTTSGEWWIRVCVASRVYQNQLDLFCLNEFQDLKHQLDDTVAFQWAEGDQFTGGGNDDPEGGMTQEVHVSKQCFVSVYR